MNFLVAYAKLAEQLKAINDAANAMNEVFIAMNKANAQFDADDLREYLYDHILSAVSMHDACILHEFATLANSSQFAKLREYLSQYSDEQLEQMNDDQRTQFISNAIKNAQQNDVTESHCIVCNSHAQLVCCCDDCIDNAMKMHSDESDFIDDDE